MENETVNNFNETDAFQLYENVDESLSISARQYIRGMYDEFKKCFDNRNFGRIERIKNNILNVDPSSNILNLIYGAICLFKGEGAESYNFFMKYASNCTSVDPWAVTLMGTWNLFAGENKLALKQFSSIANGQFSTRSIAYAILFAAKAKKKIGFFNRAKNYLERLLSTSEGYKMIPIIKLELIHIRILKKQYDEVIQEIGLYCNFYNNIYVERLKVYIMYLKGQYKEILKYKKLDVLDPYISYIIARIGLENSKIFNVDVGFYLDETIKETKGNEYIYNTYGNYCYTKNRFSDAAEHYNNSLLINPKFEPAIHNIALFVKAGTKSDQPIYITKNPIGNDFVLIDVEPDLEELGFFDTWCLLGFASFYVDKNFIKVSPSLKYYFGND